MTEWFYHSILIYFRSILHSLKNTTNLLLYLTNKLLCKRLFFFSLVIFTCVKSWISPVAINTWNYCNKIPPTMSSSHGRRKLVTVVSCVKTKNEIGQENQTKAWRMSASGKLKVHHQEQYAWKEADDIIKSAANVPNLNKMFCFRIFIITYIQLYNNTG